MRCTACGFLVCPIPGEDDCYTLPEERVIHDIAAVWKRSGRVFIGCKCPLQLHVIVRICVRPNRRYPLRQEKDVEMVRKPNAELRPSQQPLSLGCVQGMPDHVEREIVLNEILHTRGGQNIASQFPRAPDRYARGDERPPEPAG